MSNVKNIILKKKIGETIFDLMTKTTIFQVYVDDTTTLASKLDTITADIEEAQTKLSELIGEGEAGSIAAQIKTAVDAAKAAIENEEDPESLGGKIAAINDASTGILATAKTYTDEKLGLDETGYNTVKEYVEAVKAELATNISGVFHFQGALNYVSELPTDASKGDVYEVKYSGTEGEEPLNAEYAYNGTEWIELGSFVDLSKFSTTEQTTSAIAAAKEAAITAAAEDATSKDTALKAELTAMISEKARFIVSAEKPDDLTEADFWGCIVE